MPNIHKGEIGFECGGQQYVLRYSTNALIEIEGALDMNVTEVSAALGNVQNLRMGTVRTIFWAGLRDRQVNTSQQVAGEIMFEIGFARTMELIGLAFQAAFPGSEDVADRPPQPAPATEARPAGTGQSSSGGGESSVEETRSSGKPPLATSPGSSEQLRLA